MFTSYTAFSSEAGAIIFLTIYNEYLLLNIVFLIFTSYTALSSEAGTISEQLSPTIDDEYTYMMSESKAFAFLIPDCFY